MSKLTPFNTTTRSDEDDNRRLPYWFDKTEIKHITKQLKDNKYVRLEMSLMHPFFYVVSIPQLEENMRFNSSAKTQSQNDWTEVTMEDLVNDLKAAESQVKTAAEKTTVGEPMDEPKNDVDKE